MSKIIVPIYKAKCAICSYMNPQATKTFPCHYSKGNELCPAQNYVFSVGFRADLFAAKYAKSTVEGDVDGLKKILDLVKNQPDSVQESFWNKALAELFSQVEVEEVDAEEGSESSNASAPQKTVETPESKGEETTDWN